MAKFASSTKVPVNNSKNEIEHTLKRYGSSGFMYANDEDDQGTFIAIAFKVDGRGIKMCMRMPDPKADEFSKDNRGRDLAPSVVESRIQQDERRRWRSLTLIVKAKLEAVDSGVATFDQEFMPYMVLPSGKTISEELLPKLAAWRTTGKLPLLLGPAPKKAGE